MENNQLKYTSSNIYLYQLEQSEYSPQICHQLFPYRSYESTVDLPYVDLS